MITVEEVQAVLKQMKSDKTPGIDGLPVEFYVAFWDTIGGFLMRSIQGAFANGELSITQKRGVISCIPKGNKPREFLKNWRPISLLNTDYKIIASVLASRMKTVLNHTIGPNQKGFLKGRYIEENTRLIYDLIQYCKENNKAGLLLLLDFEKAFDSLNWSYMSKVLKMYNFGEEFLKWIEIIYKNSQCCVINNGHYSPFFNLGRGCRQGDPLSPYLFILSIEPLAQFIIQSIDIKGVMINENCIKLGQYADDTFLVLDGSEGSLRSVMAALKGFELCSGLKINVEKTQAVLLGNQVAPRCPEFTLNYTTTFNLLGIQFSTDLSQMDCLNFEPKISIVRKVCASYNRRKLTLQGKITVIKMFILPKLVHLFSVLPTPKKQIMDEFKVIINQFLWDNKTPKVALNTLVQTYIKGGQNMLHVDSFCMAMKIAWLNKIYNSPISNSWFILFLNIVKEKKNMCYL